MSYVYDYSKLLGKLREKGITQTELAKRLDISEAALNCKLKNRSQFKQNEMLDILNILQNDISYIEIYFFNHILVKTQDF